MYPFKNERRQRGDGVCVEEVNSVCSSGRIRGTWLTDQSIGRRQQPDMEMSFHLNYLWNSICEQANLNLQEGWGDGSFSKVGE